MKGRAEPGEGSIAHGPSQVPVDAVVKYLALLERAQEEHERRPVTGSRRNPLARSAFSCMLEEEIRAAKGAK